jgi:hypothetical protein
VAARHDKLLPIQSQLTFLLFRTVALNAAGFQDRLDLRGEVDSFVLSHRDAGVKICEKQECHRSKCGDATAHFGATSPSRPLKSRPQTLHVDNLFRSLVD